MEIEHVLRDVGLILGAGLVSQVVATLTRLPEMIVLLVAGAVIGPSVLGLASNPLDGTGAQLLFNIGVALILFHGGVGISLRVISRTAVGITLLVLPGIVITAVIVALAVAPIFGVSFVVALHDRRRAVGDRPGDPDPPVRPTEPAGRRSPRP